MAHKLTYERPDGSKVDWDLTGLEDAAYDRGFADGKRKTENVNGTTEKLAQIDRMARQIEESHSALRKRNAEIKHLQARIVELEAKLEKAKLCNEREARAEAWDEGWKHDADYQMTFGQFCKSEECNPYRQGENK